MCEVIYVCPPSGVGYAVSRRLSLDGRAVLLRMGETAPTLVAEEQVTGLWRTEILEPASQFHDAHTARPFRSSLDD